MCLAQEYNVSGSSDLMSLYKRLRYVRVVGSWVRLHAQPFRDSFLAPV